MATLLESLMPGLENIKREAKEFFDLLKGNPSLDKANAAFKGLGIVYMTTDFKSELEMEMSARVLKIAGDELMKYEVATIRKGGE